MRLCIPTLCRYDLLARLIESAEAGTVKPTGYYIIDNGGGFQVSKVEALMKGLTVAESKFADFPAGVDFFMDGLTVARPRENLGVAPSWNKFLSLREPVIIVNDDVILKPHALETIIRELEDGRPFVEGFGFALFGITPECVERVGYFDEQFFPAYFEDCDYELRMRRAGVLRSRYAPGELALHEGWSTTHGVSAAQGEELAAWLTKAPEKNRVYFLEKWGAVTGHCSGGGEDSAEVFQEPFQGKPPAGWRQAQRCPPKPMRWDVVNRIAKLIDAKTYLEIGVADGESMRHVDIPVRHGVDPMPSPGGQRACTAYFPYSSRYFFEEYEHVPAWTQYDIIFIDGDHKADLVYYEVAEALKHLSPKGVIVLHDCNPATEAMQTDEYQGGLWSGTVWKAIARLRAEWQHGVRVIDADYGIGIVVPGLLLHDSPPPSEWVEREFGEMTYSMLEENRASVLGLVSGWDWEEWFQDAFVERDLLKGWDSKEPLTEEDLERIERARERVMGFAVASSPEQPTRLDENMHIEIDVLKRREPSNFFPSEGSITMDHIQKVRESLATSEPPKLAPHYEYITPRELEELKKNPEAYARYRSYCDASGVKATMIAQEPEEVVAAAVTAMFDAAVVEKLSAEARTTEALGVTSVDRASGEVTYGPIEPSTVLTTDDLKELGLDPWTRYEEWRRENETYVVIPIERVAYDPTKHNEEDLKARGYAGPGWYYYDETWTRMRGPHASAKEARVALDLYAESIDA